MVGQDLFSPCDDGVHNLVVCGDLAGGVEIGEPSQRLVGLVPVVGLVEFLESVPRGSETGMGVEQPVEVRLVGFAEMVDPHKGGKSGSEHLRLERWEPPLGFVTLYLPAYQGEALGEPAHDSEQRPRGADAAGKGIARLRLVVC